MSTYRVHSGQWKPGKPGKECVFGKSQEKPGKLRGNWEKTLQSQGKVGEKICDLWSHWSELVGIHFWKN